MKPQVLRIMTPFLQESTLEIMLPLKSAFQQSRGPSALRLKELGLETWCLDLKIIRLLTLSFISAANLSFLHLLSPRQLGTLFRRAGPMSDHPALLAMTSRKSLKRNISSLLLSETR